MIPSDKLIKLFEFYARGEAGGDWLSSVEPRRLCEDDYANFWAFDKLRDYEDARRHAAWMATQAIGFVEEAQVEDDRRKALAREPIAGEDHDGVEFDAWVSGIEASHKFARSKREKAHRWLGFIQATLWLCGAYTLDELKEHSRKASDDPEKPETKTEKDDGAAKKED